MKIAVMIVHGVGRPVPGFTEYSTDLDVVKPIAEERVALWNQART